MITHLLDKTTKDFCGALGASVRGAVRFDRLARLLYSTDASSYQIIPVGIVVPLDVADLSSAVRVAAAYGVPIIPRGAGTSLSGQVVGTGLILDISRHLQHILEIDVEERWIRVEAGAVLDQVNAALRRHGLMIGPDPASSAAATIGGMTGNNSTGSRSIVHGMMADHVSELGVVLSDGSVTRFSPRSPQSISSLIHNGTLEGAIYERVPQILHRFGEDIDAGYPSVWRNVAGYNLHRVKKQLDTGASLNLAPLIVGSEGTLAVVTDVKLNLVDRPAASRFAVVHFDSLEASLDTIPLILESQPSSIELIDRFFMELTRSSAEFGPRLHFVEGNPAVILLVEFAGMDMAALADRAENLEHSLRRNGHGGAVVHSSSPADIADVWITRKASFGLLMSQRGDAKPLCFADDAVVPVERLTEFALAARKLCRDAGTEPAFSAHASAGCLHIMPLLSLKTERGMEQMRLISQGMAELAISLGGTTTGEHGEGLARSYYNEALYGPRLHQAFRELKEIFDPSNLMNPGKIVDAPTPWSQDILRIHPGYVTPLAPTMTYLDFSAEGGFAGAVEMCNGQGLCRKQDVGVMCPSFMATHEETHSTRGRANALRAAVTGALSPEGLGDRALYEALDLCLQCKACGRECPSRVDMARLKAEFLAHYQHLHGVPLRSLLFGNVETLNRWASRFPRFSNAILANRLVRRLLSRALGIDRRRSLPLYAEETFHQRLRKRPTPTFGSTGRRAVVFWDDIYVSHHEPEIGMAAVSVLESAGFEVRVLSGPKSDGRPLISKGLLAQARRIARHNTALLGPYAARGIPIVGTEPSSMITFRDEYPGLLRNEQARLLGSQSFLIEEFLARLADRGELNLRWTVPSRARHVLVHGHCYQKAVTGTAPLLRMLRLLPDTTVEEIQAGCCGMAGSFGYESEHYDLSMAIGEDRLFPAVRSASPDTIIAAAGFSCRQHIEHGTGRAAVHPIVVLADGLVP